MRLGRGQQPLAQMLAEGSSHSPSIWAKPRAFRSGATPGSPRGREDTVTLQAQVGGGEPTVYSCPSVGEARYTAPELSTGLPRTSTRACHASSVDLPA